MSATRGEAVLLALALAAGGCQVRDVKTHPWSIQATVGGIPIVQLVTEPTLVTISGTAQRTDEVTLLVTGAERTDGPAPTPVGDVRVWFDRFAAPDVDFPVSVEGQQVILGLLVDPAATGPDLGPLEVPSVIVAMETPAGFRNVFYLYEASYRTEKGHGADVRLFPADFFAEVLVQWQVFEPAECGLVYYDEIEAHGATQRIDLRHGERQTLRTFDDNGGTPDVDESERWTFVHATSWHRDGACRGQASAWTQFTARRAP